MRFLLFFISIVVSAQAIFLITPNLIAVFAQSTTTCAKVEVGTPPENEVLDPRCSTGTGEVPSADRVALLAKIKQYEAEKKLTFSHDNDRTGMTNGTGVVRRKDGANVTIDTQVLRFYVYMVEQGFTFNVSSMIGTHAKLSASGNVSRHWDGFGIDINVINGQDINNQPATAKPETIKFMKVLNDLIGGDLVPRQVICAGNGRNDPEVDALSMNKSVVFPGFSAKYVGDHTDHVHVGY